MCLPRTDSPQQVLERAETEAEGWQRCQRLTKTEAETLLDWLEAHGYAQREVVYVPEQGFTVRWRK
jgi:hypothetical protein